MSGDDKSHGERTHEPEDTPRTNAMLRALRAPGEGDCMDPTSLCRKLERELAAFHRSFEGHVYVKNEDYAALCEKARMSHVAATAVCPRCHFQAIGCSDPMCPGISQPQVKQPSSIAPMPGGALRFGADRFDGDQPVNVMCVLASDYDALRLRFEKACGEITRLSATRLTMADALDRVAELIGAAEGRHFSAIGTATTKEDKRRHGTKAAFAMELRASIRALAATERAIATTDGTASK